MRRLRASSVERPAVRRGGRYTAAAGVVVMAASVACAGGRGATDVPGSPAAGVSAAAASAVTPPTRDYFAFVVSEATDEVALVRYGPEGARIERTSTVGIHPADPDGPHGAAVSPDGEYYYVTTGHGTPYGSMWKYATADDAVLGRTELGMFPASLQVTPDGMYAYAANFNAYGEMVPSSVSIVATDGMVEVARLETCTMPHGSRFDPSGARHYSTCMMDDMLVEIDTRAFEVSRRFVLTPDDGGRCSPTWATPSIDGTRVYVACNAADHIVEVDVASWRVVRRIPAGDGVYNLDITHDGRTLIATNKRGRSVSLFDIASGREAARIDTQRPVVHGIAVTDDDRYAFISVEGIGSMPGTVEIVDLRAHRRVDSVDVGQMSGGIAFWKSE